MGLLGVSYRFLHIVTEKVMKTRNLSLNFAESKLCIEKQMRNSSKIC